jgi:hypothetical protein
VLASSAPLRGPISATPIAGIASFTGVIVDSAGTGLELVASSNGLADATSDPFDIVFGDARLGELTATPSRADADGISTVRLVLTVTNAAGIPIAGLQVTLTATGTGNVFGMASGVTDAQGVFTTTLASTVAERKIVTADRSRRGRTDVRSLTCVHAGVPTRPFHRCRRRSC